MKTFNLDQWERDMDEALRQDMARAWREGALWAAVECGAIPDENTPWLVPSDNPYSPRMRVYKDVQGDWIAEDACDYCVCSDWYGAMEWAYGHLAMGHYKEKT